VACHGPQKAGGGFRLDTYDRLLAGSKTGRAIVPGKSADSELYRLLTSTEQAERMPKKADALATRDIDLIRRWIDGGAAFDGSDVNAPLVALVPMKQPDPPSLYSHAVPILALAFDPHGKEIATGGYQEVLVWNPCNGQLRRRIPRVGQRVHGLAYSPDGSVLAVASGTPGEYGDVRTFEPKKGHVLQTLGISSDLVLGVAFSPDGKLVASAGADRALRVHRVGDGQQVCCIKQAADWVTAVSFNRSGTSVAGASRDGMVKVFDPYTGALQATYGGHAARVHAAVFDPDGDRICTTGDDRRVHIWDPRVVAAADGTAAQMEERFRKELPARHIKDYLRPVLALAIRNGHVFSAAADGSVCQHDLASLRLTRKFLGHHDWVYALAVDPGGQRLAAGTFDGTVRIWSIDDGRLLTVFTAAPLSRTDPNPER
jgi:hypothetical protein